MAEINPYLSFNDNCEEAFEFYRSVFGGEFTGIARFSDMDWGMEMDEAEKSKVMHVALPIGNGILMGSDTPNSMGTVAHGSTISVAITPGSESEARRIFDALSAGGTVTMPLDKAPWGALFGMFTDKFGFGWMVNHELGPQDQADGSS